jgi:hypothetical protein
MGLSGYVDMQTTFFMLNIALHTHTYTYAWFFSWAYSMYVHVLHAGARGSFFLVRTSLTHTHTHTFMHDLLDHMLCMHVHFSRRSCAGHARFVHPSLEYWSVKVCIFSTFFTCSSFYVPLHKMHALLIISHVRKSLCFTVIMRNTFTFLYISLHVFLPEFTCARCKVHTLTSHTRLKVLVLMKYYRSSSEL